MENIDKVDLRLIRCLQESPRASYATIARMSGIPGTTVRRRVEALIDAKIITPAMLPDLYKIGYTTSAMVGVKVDMERVDEIALQLKSFPEITLVALTMGRFDIMFFVAQPTLEDLTQFMSQQIAPIEGVRDTETLVTPRILKVLGDWRIPLDGSNDEFPPNPADGTMKTTQPAG